MSYRCEPFTFYQRRLGVRPNGLDSEVHVRVNGDKTVESAALMRRVLEQWNVAAFHEGK
jgi:hypothetical protein